MASLTNANMYCQNKGQASKRPSVFFPEAGFRRVRKIFGRLVLKFPMFCKHSTILKYCKHNLHPRRRGKITSRYSIISWRSYVMDTHTNKSCSLHIDGIPPVVLVHIRPGATQCQCTSFIWWPLILQFRGTVQVTRHVQREGTLETHHSRSLNGTCPNT